MIHVCISQSYCIYYIVQDKLLICINLYIIHIRSTTLATNFKDRLHSVMKMVPIFSPPSPCQRMASPRKSGKFYHPKCGSYHTLEGASPRIELGPPRKTANLSPGIRKGKLKAGKTLKNHMGMSENGVYLQL